PLRVCPECGRLYWPGGHVRHMQQRLAAWQQMQPHSANGADLGTTDERHEVRNGMVLHPCRYVSRQEYLAGTAQVSPRTYPLQDLWSRGFTRSVARTWRHLWLPWNASRSRSLCHLRSPSL